MINNDKITGAQLWILIVLTVLGVGIFSLPREVTEITGADGWITTILGGALAFLNFYFISRLVKRFPGDTLVEIANKALGKFLGIPLILIFWAYLLAVVAITLRIFGEVVKMTLLSQTPIEVIILSLIIVSLILARGGIEPIVRFDEITFFIILLSLIVIILLAIPRSDFSNILPILRTEPVKLLYGAYKTTYAFGGYEIVLLIIPFLQKPDKILKSGVIAFTIICVIYVLIVILSLAKFGSYDVKNLIWPTLSMIRSINVPGSFIEKLEGVAMALWVLLAFTTIVPFVYGLGLIPSRLLKQKEFKHFCTIIIPIIYLGALIPDNIVEAHKYLGIIINYLGVISIFVLPILLFIVSSIRRMGVQKNV